MNRRSVPVLALLVVLLIPGALLSQDQAPDGLRDRVAKLLAERDYQGALRLLDAPSRAVSTDNETRQYALLTTAEIHLIYLDQPDLAVGPLKTLVDQYFPDSPYVATARYHLGSLYMDRDDAVNAFSNLAQVPRSSKLYGDAQVKLDWAANNLRNVVRLPMGVEIPVRWLGLIALLSDVLFMLLWITQSVLSKGKNKYVWGILIVLAMAKIVISLQLASIAT